LEDHDVPEELGIARITHHEFVSDTCPRLIAKAQEQRRRERSVFMNG
jgi:hypothetical protein